MAIDMFIKIGDIKGEAQDSDHKDEIDVLSWDWSMNQSGSSHVGGGGGSGKVSVEDLTVEKYVDKATPNLMMACSNGSHYKDATLTVRKAGGKKPLEYIVVTMEDVLVTEVNTGGNSDDDRLKERVRLNFAKVKYDYQPQKPDGSKDGGQIKYGWDIAQNKKI